MAADVGGVSATANPIANSSGSVTNQAIQVLQGPYITNTYGNGIQCQGATMNVTPYVTGGMAFKRPYEAYYDEQCMMFMMLMTMDKSITQAIFYIICLQELIRKIHITYH